MGKFSELINQMIQRMLESAEFTSASPGHINTLIQVNAEDNPDFEAEIKKLIKDPSKASTSEQVIEDKKQAKQLHNVEETIDIFKKGNIGEVQNFTSTQFDNVRSLAQNPSGFIMQTFFRKFAKGVGIVTLALLIWEAVQWIITELLKPGRLLDRRFKRDIRNEIIAFRRREEQQKIKQGFSSIIITTSPRLRGGYAQTYNTLDIPSGRVSVPDNFGSNNVLMTSASGVSLNYAQSTRRGK